MLPGVVVKGVEGLITPDTFSHITASLPVGVNAVGNRSVNIIISTLTTPPCSIKHSQNLLERPDQELLM